MPTPSELPRDTSGLLAAAAGVALLVIVVDVAVVVVVVVVVVLVVNLVNSFCCFRRALSSVPAVT